MAGGVAPRASRAHVGRLAAEATGHAEAHTTGGAAGPSGGSRTRQEERPSCCPPRSLVPGAPTWGSRDKPHTMGPVPHFNLQNRGGCLCLEASEAHGKPHPGDVVVPGTLCHLHKTGFLSSSWACSGAGPWATVAPCAEGGGGEHRASWHVQGGAVQLRSIPGRVPLWGHPAARGRPVGARGSERTGSGIHTFCRGCAHSG